MPDSQALTLRLTIEDPVPGVAYSLQDRKSQPVGAIVAGEAPVCFDVPVQVAPGPRFLGEFVRREGAERRFVYIAIGAQAGDCESAWSRRAKVDIHTLPADLLGQALGGHVLEARLPGRDKDGGPACATLRPPAGWAIASKSS
jgi:hypothetical protein